MGKIWRFFEPVSIEDLPANLSQLESEGWVIFQVLVNNSAMGVLACKWEGEE